MINIEHAIVILRACNRQQILCTAICLARTSFFNICNEGAPNFSSDRGCLLLVQPYDILEPFFNVMIASQTRSMYDLGRYIDPS